MLCGSQHKPSSNHYPLHKAAPKDTTDNHFAPLVRFFRHLDIVQAHCLSSGIILVSASLAPHWTTLVHGVF
ncbi:Uncharacterised protein [Vibrio cholerae]|nr:Uncharacterised protein [Vibrio cholerae]